MNATRSQSDPGRARARRGARPLALALAGVVAGTVLLAGCSSTATPAPSAAAASLDAGAPAAVAGAPWSAGFVTMLDGGSRVGTVAIDGVLDEFAAGSGIASASGTKVTIGRDPSGDAGWTAAGVANWFNSRTGGVSVSSSGKRGTPAQMTYAFTIGVSSSATSTADDNLVIGLGGDGQTWWIGPDAADDPDNAKYWTAVSGTKGWNGLVNADNTFMYAGRGTTLGFVVCDTAKTGTDPERCKG